jgi:membrane protein implicated in regulation of membrane protease activity
MFDYLIPVVGALSAGVVSTIAGVFVWTTALLESDSAFVAFLLLYIAFVMYYMTYRSLVLRERGMS